MASRERHAQFLRAPPLDEVDPCCDKRRQKPSRVKTALHPEFCSRSGPSLLPSIPGGIMQRKASAVWQGNLKSGKGTISTASGVLSNTQYSFSTRFENGVGTNPEELIAAAHAGCFSMALSAPLGEAGLTAGSIAPPPPGPLGKN